MSEELFKELKKELKLAIVKHYKEIEEMFRGKDFYGYALYTSDDVSSIGAVANTRDSIPVDASDEMYIYYRYSPDEWSQWDDFEIFDTVNKIIKESYCLPNVEFSRVKSKILSISLETMMELQREGLFGVKSNEKYLIIWVSDSDHSIMEISAKELNTSKVYEDYAEEFE